MIKRQNIKNSEQVKITFVQPHDPAQPRISVVGDFNDWEPGASPLIKRSNNTRSVTVTLEAGRRYAFRYYQEDGRWFNDEAADEYVKNEHGGENCVVIT
jgi:1,4-alpha-glucan branching enzyme